MKIQKIKIIYKFKNKKAPRGAFYFAIFRAIRRLKINFAYFFEVVSHLKLIYDIKFELPYRRTD